MVCKASKPITHAHMTESSMTIQASRFLMEMAESIKIERPDHLVNGTSNNAVRIDANPAPFLPMRRKLRMPIDS